MDTKERVHKILDEAFGNGVVTSDTVLDDVDGWDSFEHINLIVGVEDEFGFKIPMGKVVSMKNVGEMVDIILSMGH